MHPAATLNFQLTLLQRKKEQRRHSYLHNFHVILIIDVEYDSDGGFIAQNQVEDSRCHSGFTSTSNCLHQDVILFSGTLHQAAPQNIRLWHFMHNPCIKLVLTWRQPRKGNRGWVFCSYKLGNILAAYSNCYWCDKIIVVIQLKMITIRYIQNPSKIKKK